MNSRRLPGKALLDLGGMPVLEHVYLRALAIEGIDRLVVATTTDDEDDLVEEWARARSARVFRGSAHDVAGRLLEASADQPFDYIARITADCPLIDPEISSEVITQALTNRLVFCCNYMPATYPDGLDFSIFRRDALESRYQRGLSDFDKEHVTTVFEHRPAMRNLGHVSSPSDHSSLRWTLDNRQDYRFLRALAKTAGTGLVGMGFSEILDLVHGTDDLYGLQDTNPRNYGHTVRRSHNDD